MRLGVDLDGTVADLHGALAREASRLFQPPRRRVAQPAEALVGIQEWSELQRRRLWKAVLAQENFWEGLDEIEPGALARLWRLASEQRWDVVFMTSRPRSEGDATQLQSHRWLTAHGFERPSVLVVEGSRGRVAAALALDIVVDDRIDNCISVAVDSNARPLLVWRGEEAEAPTNTGELGIGMVRSVSEALDLLERTAREGDERGFVDRVRLLLGLRGRRRRARS